MKKSDVEFHRLGYSFTAVPAVNVKVYRSVWELTDEEWYDATDGLSSEELAAFREWADDYFDSEESCWTFDAARESEWEYLADWAPELFDQSVKVYSEGRSGGWAVVVGLPDFESWDAIMLGKWARFARICRSMADNIPVLQVSLAYLNVWEPDQEGRREDVELAMTEGVAR